MSCIITKLKKKKNSNTFSSKEPFTKHHFSYKLKVTHYMYPLDHFAFISNAGYDYFISTHTKSN